jgi:hypothetical protein
MTIEHRIDHGRRLVLTRAFGTMTDEEIFAYQREVWSRPDVAGYDELVDMTEVEHVAVPSPDRVRRLARLSAAMDAPGLSKFAIVAPRDLEFGLGRMFAAHRELSIRSTKQVSVFRSTRSALAWLGVTDGPPGGS